MYTELITIRVKICKDRFYIHHGIDKRRCQDVMSQYDTTLLLLLILVVVVFIAFI